MLLYILILVLALIWAFAITHIGDAHGWSTPLQVAVVLAGAFAIGVFL